MDQTSGQVPRCSDEDVISIEVVNRSEEVGFWDKMEGIYCNVKGTNTFSPPQQNTGRAVNNYTTMSQSSSPLLRFEVVDVEGSSSGSTIDPTNILLGTNSFNPIILPTDERNEGGRCYS